MESVCSQVGLVGVVVLVLLVGVSFVGRCRVFDRGADLGGPSSVPVPGFAIGDVSWVGVGAWHQLKNKAKPCQHKTKFLPAMPK